ncbi:hypothetical protein Tco_0495837 [Tanacetum coccineum]
MAPLPTADQRHLWLRYQVEGYTKGIVHSYEQRLETIWSRPVNQVYVLDFKGLTPGMRQDFVVSALDVNRCKQERGSRIYDTEMGLDEIVEAGFGAYWDGSDRLIPDKGDLRDYLDLDLADRYFWPRPFFCFLIRDLHAEGRKSKARLSGGHFIGRLAMHFGLVSNKGLRGLHVVTRELPLIDLHELRRLNICSRYEDTWAWVCPGPSSMQAPPPPPPAPQPQTMSQRIERIKEEMSDLRHDIVGLRGVVKSFITEQSRVST